MQKDSSGASCTPSPPRQREEGPSRATGFPGGQLVQDKLGLASTFHNPAPSLMPLKMLARRGRQFFGLTSSTSGSL